MREEIGYMIKGVSDHSHKELTPAEVYETFKNEYINKFNPIDITDATFRKNSTYKGDDGYTVDIHVNIAGTEYFFTASGNGRLDAVSNALRQSKLYSFDYTFVTYAEHALEAESNSRAAAYVAIADANGKVYWGVGMHEDIILASINALVSAINRLNQVSHFITK